MPRRFRSEILVFSVLGGMFPPLLVFAFPPPIIIFMIGLILLGLYIWLGFTAMPVIDSVNSKVKQVYNSAHSLLQQDGEDYWPTRMFDDLSFQRSANTYWHIILLVFSSVVIRFPTPFLISVQAVLMMLQIWRTYNLSRRTSVSNQFGLTKWLFSGLLSDPGFTEERQISSSQTHRKDQDLAEKLDGYFDTLVFLGKWERRFIQAYLASLVLIQAMIWVLPIISAFSGTLERVIIWGLLLASGLMTTSRLLFTVRVDLWYTQRNADKHSS